MRKERLQNHVSGSVFTLPVCAFVALLLWWFPLRQTEASSFWERLQFDTSHYIALALVTLVTYVLIEMNNVNILIRVRSRMVSSMWLLSVATIASTHTYSPGLAASLCLAIAYFMLFRTYQHRHSEGSTFHHALMLGLSSVFVPYMVGFLPFFIWHQTVFLRSMSLRSLCATLVGFIFPFLLWAGYAAFCEDYAPLLAWYGLLTSFTPITPALYQHLPLVPLVSWSVVSVLSWIGMLHYLSTSYNDKIKVRMFLYVFVCQFVVLEVFVGLQPQHMEAILPLLVVTGVPLMAHFFALTGSWFTNTLFVLAMLAYVALGYLNLFWSF